jgi:branched-chain amino acid transport system permease protein
MRCLADDQLGAQAAGVSVKKIYAISWALAAVVAFGAGILVGNISGVSASLETFGLKVFPAIILGGLESLGGVIIAGMILGVLESITIGYLSFLMPVNIGSGVLRDVVPFIILIIILMVKPYGLFGLKEIEKM